MSKLYTMCMWAGNDGEAVCNIVPRGDSQFCHYHAKKWKQASERICVNCGGPTLRKSRVGWCVTCRGKDQHGYRKALRGEAPTVNTIIDMAKNLAL